MLFLNLECLKVSNSTKIYYSKKSVFDQKNTSCLTRPVIRYKMRTNVELTRIFEKR